MACLTIPQQQEGKCKSGSIVVSNHGKGVYKLASRSTSGYVAYTPANGKTVIVASGHKCMVSASQHVMANSCVGMHDATVCGDLEEFLCYNNGICELSIGKCDKLWRLSCQHNCIQELDLRRCRNLMLLECHVNLLKSLMTNGLSELRKLCCDDNDLMELNLADCRRLEMCSCENNRIREIDTKGCRALTELRCKNNRIRSLNISHCYALRALDLTMNPTNKLYVTREFASARFGLCRTVGSIVSPSRAIQELVCTFQWR